MANIFFQAFPAGHLPPKGPVLVFLALFLSPIIVHAQYYSLKISSAGFEVDSVAYSGYQTTFLQPYKEVKKAWWKYIKTKAVIQNKITHYDLKFPGQKGEKEVYGVSVLQQKDSLTSVLQFALKKDSIRRDQWPELTAQVKPMLLEFKTGYYVGILERQIKNQEKQAARIGRQIDRLKSGKPGSKLPDTVRKEQEDALLSDLAAVEKDLASLKARLREIK